MKAAGVFLSAEGGKSRVADRYPTALMAGYRAILDDANTVKAIYERLPSIR